MSMSSVTTLISPTSTKAATPSTSGPGLAHRRPSVHSSHGIKRRPSQHTAHHGHHAHSHSSTSSGSKKSNEGEHGRRAVAAGLAMHALDTADAAIRKKKEKRPIHKASRSDTHLPRLSRTASMTSNTSHESAVSHTQGVTRPRRGSHKKSEESITVMNEKGEITAEGDGKELQVEEEEGWESGNDGQLEISPVRSKKGKERTTNTKSSIIRRTQSDTSAEPNQLDSTKKSQSQSQHNQGILDSGDLVETPSEVAHLPALTQKTTGFAGTIQPPDPQLAAQLPTHDPHPIVTPHPIRRNASAKSLVGPIVMEPANSGDSSLTDPATASKRQPSSERGGSRERKDRPVGSSRLRSTDGSGLPKNDQPETKTSTSPSYPFPRLVPEDAEDAGSSRVGDQKQQSQRQQSHAPQPRHHSEEEKPQSQQRQRPQPQSRSRQTSSQHPQLRHRYSNSSLRSIQSLRAPPHPLNSPTAYRSQATVATSRPGSMFGSPTKDDKRQVVPSMHQPPVPKPQISYEIAQGQGFDGSIPEEDQPRSSRLTSTKSHTNRKDSISSNKSLANIFAPLATPTMSSPTRSISGPGQSGRRKTALEAASDASKMSSTNDPTLYHSSLGHANIPETVYLVSRFLPQKKIVRPKWEMDMRDPTVHEELEAGGMKVGLTNGDYREAHESLIKTLKHLNININNQDNNNQPKRGGSSTGFSRSYSGYANLLTNSTTASSTTPGGGSDENLVVGTINLKGKDGLAIKKGTFAGKTPFELSVQRCLAQRPTAPFGL
ncbi:uncharacterized protein IL334_003285 [Kwoniella shivajii]|uniref:Uncharacterized protein n=1 Tax=Kwoniella shivajii TaxID=564305 RepID=A0ABZ1CXF8_9TREE|nr:hypothetical protein IL334_003285 [Kwoniella shivajii]